MGNNVTDQQIEDFLSQFDSLDDGFASIAKFVRSTKAARLHPKVQPTALHTPVIISFKDVTKTYKISKQRLDALKDVSFDIHEGEIIAITGKSGSGKSTLLQLIGCLDKPTQGDILIDQKNPRKLSDNKLSQLRQNTIGFVFQSFYLQPFLKLDQNISVPAMFTHAKNKQINESVESLLDQVDLAEHRKHYPKELSGGQIQRAAIARALINKPKVILADEPTGNLDSVNSQAIIELFKYIRDELGTTIIIVTHDEQIAHQADRVITLKDGEII